ncbi:ribosomal protection tetracycline resistance protein [Amycolatopsis arida]|uniref:Ribosomal protection tetracycline resistance protein n=1 Tax=Amycolatopsis arida TaxID=587909 RepID=A0A1I5QSB2_9PSEU|nr:ribosomal protection tetracycline resistance protein [Amycolatopsis arida]SFP48736.1 ribosomal protection tetracycline resistance protein [Amycolatopsis arida]
MTTINIGILAHVDAGKTTLTERLLFDAGAIADLGSVDGGNTRTDTLDIERRRGITIRSGVVSFDAGDRTVNIIDTPRHSDFVGEVERALRVLDGAVLVVSATSGVQAQTRILARTLRRLRVPTLVFVNKVDRLARPVDQLLTDLRRRLTPDVVPLVDLDAESGEVRAADFADPAFLARVGEVLAEHDDRCLRAYVDSVLTPELVRRCLTGQTAAGRVHPVFLGSARTGLGLPELVDGIHDLVPAAPGGDELSATVFKVERDAAGNRIAYVRLHSGSLRVREEITGYRRDDAGDQLKYRGRVTALHAATPDRSTPREAVTAGEIAMVRGVPGARVGDALGSPASLRGDRPFPPPSLSTVVTVRDPAHRPRLHAALRELSEQDPLVGLRMDELTGELSVRVYGDVQKEVIGTRLREEFGILADFAPTRPVYVEKPTGTAEVVHRIDEHGPNDVFATVGLRVEPGPPSSGVRFAVEVELGSLPRAFQTAIEETVYRTSRRPTRLAGHRLRRHADDVRVRQPGQHRRRLPDDDRAAAHPRTAAGRHAGVRAGRPVRARGAGGRGGRRARRARRPGRDAARDRSR